MADRMAGGHPYIADLGTGIEWKEGTARLWQRGAVVETATHTTATPWEFWYDLHFAEAFPMVTHWWFRSLWTGQVKVSLPDAAFILDRDVTGWVTFNVLGEVRRAWNVSESGVVVVTPPYPPNEERPANIPLRLCLAQAIVSVLNDDLHPDTWYTVTSLVKREELARTLPKTYDEAKVLFGGNWRLSHGDTTLAAPRRAICEIMGLEEPVAA